MKIIGISLDQFLLNTKTAFSAANISDIKRDSIVRKFLNFQLFPNQNPGENESRLLELFDDQSEEKEKEKNIVMMDLPSHASIVTLSFYEHNDNGSLIFDYHNQFICYGSEAINSKLKSLFESNYPEHADGFFILNSMLITRKIESLSCDSDGLLCESIENEITKDVNSMSSSEACEWLLSNFTIDDLTDDGFFSDYLHSEMLKISYSHSEVSYF